jgi:hypothetical protein
VKKGKGKGCDGRVVRKEETKEGLLRTERKCLFDFFHPPTPERAR